jgi:integrase
LTFEYLTANPASQPIPVRIERQLGIAVDGGASGLRQRSREESVNENLAQISKEIRKEEGLTSEYVFTYAKWSISRVDRALKGALDRAGIEDFKFHDLRHTFASHLIMRGASLREVRELLGHKTMTLRYAHLGQESKKKAIGLLNGLTSKLTRHKTGTFPKSQISAIG